METGIQKYLDGAKQQMPSLEAFNGNQPSYHLNEIAIRHWDGYWFGKREMWGDIFPHYWSTFCLLYTSVFVIVFICQLQNRFAGQLTQPNDCTAD